MNYHNYKGCIDACLKCIASCYHCASMDLKEKDIAMMSRCVQLDMECATMCLTVVQLMSLESESVRNICWLCADVCNKCAEECEKHTHAHCKECAEACRKCANECNNIYEM